MRGIGLTGFKESKDSVEVFTGDGANGSHVILAFRAFFLVEGGEDRVIESGDEGGDRCCAMTHASAMT